jgi:hypothetical protein
VNDEPASNYSVQAASASHENVPAGHNQGAAWTEHFQAQLMTFNFGLAGTANLQSFGTCRYNLALLGWWIGFFDYLSRLAWYKPRLANKTERKRNGKS